MAGEDLPLVRGLLHLAGRDRAHQGVNIRLIEHVTHRHLGSPWRGPSPVAASPTRDLGSVRGTEEERTALREPSL